MKPYRPKILTRPLIVALFLGIFTVSWGDEILQDNFFFLGRHDTSNVAYHFSFSREKRIINGRDSLRATFFGVLHWKNYWFQLEPSVFPTTSFSQYIIPSHPAYNFQWPKSTGKGEFFYHFEPLSILLYFNEFSPVVTLANNEKEKSEIYITNATFQGQFHTVKGVLLYHRSHLKDWRFSQEKIAQKKTKSKVKVDTASNDSSQTDTTLATKNCESNDSIGECTEPPPPEPILEEAGKLVFLNALGGQNYLIWNKLFWPGYTPSKYFLGISYDGSIYTSEKPLEEEITISDTTYSPHLEMGWTFQSDAEGFYANLKSSSFSERFRKHRFHLVEGKGLMKGIRQRFIGLVIDTRERYESLSILDKTDSDFREEIKKEKKPLIREGIRKVPEKKSLPWGKSRSETSKER